MASTAHEHHPFHAHHFDDLEQQFDAGKLGMWLFLATEVLFFSGMFVAYTVYRVNHPETFVYAHHYLNSLLGAMNTVVLLASSLSVAWGVRCIQLGNRRWLLAMLVFTLACAGFFMGVKAVEYTLKGYEGLLWAGAYQQQIPGHVHDLTAANALLQNLTYIAGGLGALLLLFSIVTSGKRNVRAWTLGSIGATLLAAALGIVVAQKVEAASHGPGEFGDLTHASPADHGSAGAAHAAEAPAAPAEATAPAEAAAAAPATPAPPSIEVPDVSAIPIPVANKVDESRLAVGEAIDSPERLAGNFFSIYFAMTGVHAIHILGGIGVIVWIVSRAAAGHFGPQYYGPVEYVGLYWHLVDLIWIFLFPLMYLIH